MVYRIKVKGTKGEQIRQFSVETGDRDTADFVFQKIVESILFVDAHSEIYLSDERGNTLLSVIRQEN